MTAPRTPQKPRGSGRPTISDVAALAGVSPGAVSKVFNGNGRISEATSERIREAARKLNWRPNAAAIALRTARAQAIGLVLTSDTSVPGVGAGNMDFISGIESLLSPREYGLLLNVFITGQHEEEHFYRTLAERQRMDGIILTNSMVGDTRPELVHRLGLPAVLVGAPWKPGVIEYVDADPPSAGIAETVDHLVALGHERVAFISGPKDFVLPVLRREAFVQRLADHGLQPHSVVAVEYSPARAAEETTTLLAGPVRPTAILYGTDTMAIAGMRTIQAAGLRVPDDISVVGFEGLALGEWVDPPLTTVQRFAFQRGRAAAAKVLTLLGETVDEPVPLEQPTLVVRGSTAPPSAAG